ncbi:hypothetical protein E4U59_005336 [Claviceps monticola]|nr:hypothetical protein E4U59_005336 [Claviceps monticola]
MSASQQSRTVTSFRGSPIILPPYSGTETYTARREFIGLYIGTPKYLGLLEEEGTTESDWMTTISCKFWTTRGCIDEWKPFSDMLVSTMLTQDQPPWSLVVF